MFMHIFNSVPEDLRLYIRRGSSYNYYVMRNISLDRCCVASRYENGALINDWREEILANDKISIKVIIIN